VGFKFAQVVNTLELIYPRINVRNDHLFKRTPKLFKSYIILCWRSSAFLKASV